MALGTVRKDEWITSDQILTAHGNVAVVQRLLGNECHLKCTHILLILQLISGLSVNQLVLIRFENGVDLPSTLRNIARLRYLIKFVPVDIDEDGAQRACSGAAPLVAPVAATEEVRFPTLILSVLASGHQSLLFHLPQLFHLVHLLS